ncbi:hypothetical protein EPA93_22250 [Ktedonosporobacter rubrisoli]|uniref:HAD family hydrolase n=1 Tax=Ktedonosporobacter rubrisoli TaxID=2509675 RepID=A0A4P6JSN2_KTERU|nr:hypothetical protein [Ktedonosporobacter rubrisoli]QBD78568.1 hypothetical protein EPA93_22250 [Ktedonosporobacter rubrisoli]
MLFAIDIDGTIARGNRQQLKRICNERFQLGIDLALLDQMSYREFFHSPQMQDYKKIVGKEYLRLSVAWLMFEPEMLLAARPFPGAVEGIKRLAELGEVTYYTARYSLSAPEKNAGMRESTLQWLHEQNFPQAERAVFCDGVADKAEQMYKLSEKQAEPIFLIDDLYEQLLSALEGYGDTFKARFTLVAFRAHTAPEQCLGIQVIPLPSWEQIDELVALITPPDNSVSSIADLANQHSPDQLSFT